MFDVEKIRKDFPLLSRKFEGNDLVYFDNAATSQKPQCVIDAISNYYKNFNANVHRGIYELSEEATNLYEDSREVVANFVNAYSSEELVFTKGTTEALNMVAFGWGVFHLQKGDVILTTISEHHSNFLPWKAVAEKTGAAVNLIDLNEDGTFSIDKFKKVLNKRVKVVCISQASNVLGTIFPLREICDLAHKQGTIVVVDGAQGLPHLGIDVREIGCDFYAFSAHKILGPMGVGVLWGKKTLLEEMIPSEYGGGMIKTVDLESVSLADLPEKLEAGTPNVAGAVGLAAALKYVLEIGFEDIRAHGISLTKYALEKLQEIEGLEIIGPTDAAQRTGLISFYIDSLHPHDIASVLSSYGVAVRSGNHCAMPLHTFLEIPASVRASFNIYNTKEEVDKFIEALKEAKKILG
jgi:cysteine desulfurase/selenocysteine lyase